MPGFGPPRGSAADAEPATVDRDTAAQLAGEFYQDGRRAGRQEADWEVAAGLLGQGEARRASLGAAQERAAYGPAGRAHFADPRPGDRQPSGWAGRGFTRHNPESATGPELEAEAG